ncbi:MAG TPA: ornithine carbamoyltransferase [Candidatus Limnocylindrales bacterium]|jgi:ornithine carbamoyltransferase
MAKHFLTLDSLGREGVREILDLSHRFKREPGQHRGALAGGRVGMIFDKPSTRTRVSLEDAAWALGMLPIVLRPDELQLGHGETVADTARVLSRYLSALTIRTFAHARVEELAANSSIPIVNALTDDHHPCQALADAMTLEESLGDLRGRRVAFVGDGNNVAHSLIQAAGYLGFTLAIATPEGYRPDAAIVTAGRVHGEETGGRIELVTDPRDAVRAADAVYTDVWASMGKEAEREERRQVFAGYTVDAAMMASAGPGAIFLHCLPAHRGDEVTDAVMDGPQSRVWDQAENRIYTEQAILYALISGDQRGERLG